MTEDRFIITRIKEIGTWDWTTPQRQCSVCGLPIRPGQTIVFCPKCGNPAHYEHLAEWVKVKGVCPICRSRIPLRKLKPVRK
ncbi:MAG: RING finger protein [Promethearchaeota archaeon]